MTRKNLLFVAAVVVLAWTGITNFWFHNVDLSYMHQYIDIVNPLGTLDFLKLIRGHVILHLPIYLFFGHNPFYYYLIALILHSILVCFLFYIIFYHTKNKTLATLAGVFAGISVSYSNVLFEGAFNLYYPFLGILLLISHIAVLQKRHNLLIITFVIGFLIRETILVSPLVVLLTIFIFEKRKSWKKYIMKFFTPFLFLTVLYILFRVTLLGELKSDLTDDAVQFRSTLISSKRFGELLITIFFNTTRLFAEQVVTPPILYSIRTNFSLIYPSVVGSLIILSIGVGLIFLYKKYKRTYWIKFMIFGFCWMLLFNLFISTVLPFPSHVVERPFNYNSVLTRYNYFGFIGFVFLLAAFSIRFKRIIYLIFIISTLYNFVLIQKGVSELYKTIHQPAKDFYRQIFEKYPSFPDQTIIYYNFFQVDNLKDYIGDLVWIFGKKFYPNTNFILETTASHTQDQLLSGKYKSQEVFVFDIDLNGKLIDKTLSFRDQAVPRKSTLSQDLLFPEGFLANKQTLVNLIARTTSEASSCSQELGSYFRSDEEFRGSASLETSSNYGDHPRFYFIDKKYLTDSLAENDFYWQADVVDSQPSIIIDLGKIREVNTFAWKGEEKSHSLPQDYKVWTSQDKTNWQQAINITQNSDADRLDLFETVNARFVKMVITSTSLGQPAKLLEIKILNLPNNFNQKWQNIGQIEDYAITTGCLWKDQKGSNKLLVQFVSTTDLGSTKAYNQVLQLGQFTYKVPILHLETVSRSRQIFEEKLDKLILKTGPNMQIIWEKVSITQ